MFTASTNSSPTQTQLAWTDSLSWICHRKRTRSSAFLRLNFIRLATPTTDDNRLAAVLTNTSGFVYYVSITGITGAAAPDTGKVTAAVARIKRHTKLPVAVGFGVRTAEHARAIAVGADGVVVGSALVDALRQGLDKNGNADSGTVKAVTNLVSTLAEGLRSARRVAAE